MPYSGSKWTANELLTLKTVLISELALALRLFKMDDEVNRGEIRLTDVWLTDVRTVGGCCLGIKTVRLPIVEAVVGMAAGGVL